MGKLIFEESKDYSLGIELEYQIINPKTCALISKAKDLMRGSRETKFSKAIKPEVTQSMIEVNTSIHDSTKTMLIELDEIRDFLIDLSNKYNIKICGGGTHPFHKWAKTKIYPASRFKHLSHIIRYLAKRATVFSEHIHIGCSNPDKAIYLTHALSRFVPQFIALSASSPFYEGLDTGFDSTRATLFSSLPLSGIMPAITTWKEFKNYFYKFKQLKIADSMKDFHWDIRPKPEFGTVEVRVCDVPLSLRKAVLIAAYIQTIAYYLLSEKPSIVAEDLYTFYSYNRFQAARYGLSGDLIEPTTLRRLTIKNDVLETLKKIKLYAKDLGNMLFLKELKQKIVIDNNDAAWLREKYHECHNLKTVIQAQCLLWKN